MTAVLVIVAGFAFATGAHTPPLSHPVTRDYVEFLESAENVLSPVLFRNSTTEACRTFYRNLHDGPHFDVRMAFGYMDSPTDEGPFVVDGTDYGMSYALDGHARAAFTQWIQRPCKQSTQLCGFRVEPEDPDLYVRTIDSEAERRREVRLRVTHASATPEYARNVEGGDRHELQFHLTQRAEGNFLGGLGQADAVLYVGHARGGGGPDFAPPILLRDGRVAYNAYYRRVKPGVKKLLHFLQNAESSAKVIGMFSCKATDLFVDRFELATIAPETMFVTQPYLSGYKSSLLAAIVVLDSLLNRRCLTEIRDMLGRVETFAEAEDKPRPLSELVDFDGVTPLN